MPIPPTTLPEMFKTGEDSVDRELYVLSEEKFERPHGLGSGFSCVTSCLASKAKSHFVLGHRLTSYKRSALDLISTHGLTDRGKQDKLDFSVFERMFWGVRGGEAESSRACATPKPWCEA